MIETYPTHLIVRTLPKIDTNRFYLRRAHKFIKREKVRAHVNGYSRFCFTFLLNICIIYTIYGIRISFSCPIAQKRVGREEEKAKNKIIIFYSICWQILWPNVKSEIILVDYLFDPKHKIKETEAVLITVLLMDLQQDFRATLKRHLLKSLMR